MPQPFPHLSPVWDHEMTHTRSPGEPAPPVAEPVSREEPLTSSPASTTPDSPTAAAVRQSSRIRRPPAYLQDYEA